MCRRVPEKPGNEARKASRANFVASFPGHDPVSGLGTRLLLQIVSGIYAVTSLLAWQTLKDKPKLNCKFVNMID